MTEHRKNYLKLAARKYRRQHPDRVKAYKQSKEQTRRDYKLQLKKRKGGKCAMCGYDKEIRILQFHHLKNKLFNLSAPGKSLRQMEMEAEKCILLCPNCHAITHLCC